MAKRTATSTSEINRSDGFLEELSSDNFRAKQVFSLGNAVVSAIHAAALGVQVARPAEHHHGRKRAHG
jgi:hypothetical protein